MGTPASAEIRLAAADFTARCRRLRWLLLDVDGVLTDGRLTYGADGGVAKTFHTRDGLGIRLLREAGLAVGTLSLRNDPAVAYRARELGLDAVLHGHAGSAKGDKTAVFSEFLAARGLDAAAVAYAGDDLPDLPVLARAGLACAPADAAAAVRAAVHVLLTNRGGWGAVRELAELLLAARGGA